MVEFDLSKITGREPPTDDGLPCACEWNAAGEWNDEDADSPEYLAISDCCSRFRAAVMAELDRLTGYTP